MSFVYVAVSVYIRTLHRGKDVVTRAVLRRGGGSQLVARNDV